MLKKQLFILIILWNFQDYVKGVDNDAFIVFNQRQNIATVKSFASLLVNTKNAFIGQVNVLDFYSQLLERKFIEMDNQLNLWELLNRPCVQKYKEIIPDSSKTQKMLNRCLQKANNGYDSLTTTPAVTLTTLGNFYKGPFVDTLKVCKLRFPGLPVNQSACSLEILRKSFSRANEYMNKFDNQMIMVKYKAQQTIKESYDCIMDILTESVNSISEVLTLVDHCIYGSNGCSQCNDNLALWEESCPDTVTVRRNDSSNSIIENPFQDLNSKVSCLQVHLAA